MSFGRDFGLLNRVEPDRLQGAFEVGLNAFLYFDLAISLQGAEGAGEWNAVV